MAASQVRLFATPLLALVLGSCSYVYTVRAVAIHGRLAFVVDDVEPFYRVKPDCIRSITVAANKGEPRAKPSQTDDRLLVLNGGVYWKEVVEVGSCPNPFRVLYGVPLSGVASREVGHVQPKPLRVGVVYEVTTAGDGGYGGGWFRITTERRIENWREDPTPPVLNEQGYDVSGRYEPPPSRSP